MCETSVKYAGNIYIHLSFCLLINPHVAGGAATWLEAAVYCTSTEPQLEINFLFKSHYTKTGNSSVRLFFFFPPSHTFAHRSFGLNTQGSSFPPTRHFPSVVMKLMRAGDPNDIKRFVGKMGEKKPKKQNSDGLTCAAALHNKVRWGPPQRGPGLPDENSTCALFTLLTCTPPPTDNMAPTSPH